MKRKCNECENLVTGENVQHGYCKADREMQLETVCEDYNLKRVDVIIIGKETFERVRYELLRTTSIFKETPNSFVTTMGKSYLFCGSVDDLRGRRANEVIVGRKMPLAEYIDTISGIINNDFTKLSTF